MSFTDMEKNAYYVMLVEKKQDVKFIYIAWTLTNCDMHKGGE